MKKRLLALFLAFVMAMSLLPVSVFADGGTSVQLQGTKDNPITANSNGVTVNKYVSRGEKDGQYNLTLEAYASNQLTTTTTTTPLDIVLVLDVSGSMDEELTDAQTEYQPVYEIDKREDYFIQDEYQYRRVEYTEAYTTEKWVWDRFPYGHLETVNHDAGWIYGYKSNPTYVEPMTSAEDTASGHTQFYTAVFTQRVTKMEALQSAVDSFIDQVSAKNDGVATESQHRISLVKFANDSYHNSQHDSVGNDKNSEGYNYTQVVKDFTSAADDLKTAVNNLDAGGATAADYGLALANHVFDSDGDLTGARSNAKKVLVFFTDGEPNHSNGFSGGVAAAAVNTAKSLKSNGVRVYTVGVFEEETDDISQYMNGVSSNYPNASAETGWYYFEYGNKNTDDVRYYALAKDAEDLNSIFGGIADSVTTGTLEANPDSEAVLSDSLSQYVKFPQGLAGSSNQITVKFAKATAYNPDTETFTFDLPTDKLPSDAKPTVTVDEKAGTITITGFDYKVNAASYNKTDNDNKVSGGKLVVTFPIEVDENACLENPVETGVYPTNSTESGSQAGLSYKSSDSADSNDASTTLSGSPAVHLTNLDGNGTDVKVQVYVDGTLVTNPFSYITLTRDSGSTSYDYIKTTLAEDGTINCDFNYDPDQGQHDCIDLEVTVTDSVYVLQGVRFYQDRGMSGTSNVTQSGGAYKIDNVTAVGNAEGEDVDCKIYLRTKYSVKYYQGDSNLTGALYNDSNVYVAAENITATTPNSPEEGRAQWMDWKNENCKTSVTLPALPTVENHDVSGWYLGRATNTAKTYTGSFNAISEDSDKAGSDADDNIIKFYATTALKSYNITINYVDGENQPLKTVYTEPKNSGASYSFDVSEKTGAAIPFTIEKEGKNYVFNQIKSGSLSGTVTGPVSITAEYLLDSDKDGTPDAYEATVTYKVVNGTWDGQDKADKTANFILKTFNKGSNTWVNANPTLADSTNNVGIPTDMKPDETHVAPGAWDTEPTANTLVTGPKTYTYTFNTTVNSKLKVEKTLEKVNGEAYTTGKVEADDVLTYTIKVTNTGNVSLSNIVVTDTFTGSAAPPTTTEGVTWTPNPESGKYEATWNVGELAADADATLTYTYTVQAADQGKTITNTAVAKSGTTENGDNNTVDVYNPGLKVNKAVTKVNNTEVAADKPVVVQKGDVLTYTITVQNTGDQKLNNVVVTDTKWSNGTEITVSGMDNPVALTSGSYTIGTLNVDETVTITYTYTVTEADVKAEKVTNNVSVKSKETPGGESGETTTNVVGDYTIEASSGANGRIDPAGSVKVAAGTDKTFTMTANAGYHIGDVTVDGKSVGVRSEYKFENVWGNHAIHVTFAKNSTPTSYTLYYHSNFGKDVSFYQSSSTRNMTVKEYENVGHLPERDGYVFVSWNTEPDGSGSRYMPGDTFRIEGSSDRLYAQWQKDKTGPDDSGVSNWLETDEHNAYLTGYPDSTFRADRNMTRAEVAQMFYALLLDKNVTITKSFSDVPDDAWYSTAVKTLASLGMMDGYPDGTFRPDEPITRAEFATVGLAFAYDPLDASCSYYDVGANAWYYTYVAQATTYGWIGGYPDNTFRPGNNITRVEVCVIVNNMLGRDADERYIDRHEDELVHFVDLSDSYWGYYTIMESTNTHEYTGSFTNEKWTDVK